jgi:pilus assembly protein TadC
VRRALPPRALQLGAAGCVAVGALVLGGAVVGGVAAVVLAPPTYLLLGRIAARPSRTPPDASLALGLDLAAVALRSGQSVAAALAVAAPALSDPVAAQWQRVAGLLALGADPEQAWASLAEDPVLAPMAATARRSADSGARLARAFGQLAVETRASLQAAAVARANRAGVLAMAPLGLCFLPAFVCLGIVPTVVGIARDVLGSVP